MTKTVTLVASLAAALILGSLGMAANAEPMNRSSGSHWGNLGPNSMMGPGMMDRTEFNRTCRPGAAGFAEWRIDRLKSILKPTDEQLTKFEDFKIASKQAGDTMRTACPTEMPNSMVSHMQAMERLSDAKSLAIKTILPSLQAFYATLSASQKANLDSPDGRSRFWRWRDRV